MVNLQLLNTFAEYRLEMCIYKSVPYNSYVDRTHHSVLQRLCVQTMIKVADVCVNHNR